MSPTMGGYSIHDIDFVAGFDVDSKKVGNPLNEAVYAQPNKVRWVDSLHSMKDAIVKQSPQLDGVGTYVEKVVTPVHERPADELRKEIMNELKDKKVEIVVSYLPVGSDNATKFWAQVCLDAKVGFVNCMPSFIASEPEWAARFEKAQIPIIGDDIKGQVGATIVHRTLAKLCDKRATKIERTYQINVGGNTDFLSMKEQDRLTSKKISKTESVQSQLKQRLPDDQIYVGPSDFIPFLGNTKLMFMRIEGRMWANIPYNMEVRLEVDDKANSAGIVVDAIRYCKIALDRKIGGPLVGPSAWLMKHPPKQFSDDEAQRLAMEFVEG
jgi:myo-inositol-1-phosphate synthase